MIEIKGIIPPILTPMNEDESLNLEELRNQVNRQIEAGVHGIFCFGTNGECYILSDKEKQKILEVTIDEAKGRVPVYAGTGCVGTKDTIRMSLMAKEVGADILSIICPYFAAASQDEIYEHFKAVAEAVDLPIVVYNIPARTGVNIAPATIAKLAKIDNIIGAKDSSGNFDNMLQYIELSKNENFNVLSGNDSLILWNLLAGGVGGIAGIANIYPKTMVSLYETFVMGDVDRAKEIQDSIRNIRNNFKYGNPNTIVKKAVNLLGYPVGPCRAPFNYICQEGIEAIKKTLEQDTANSMR
ncbi:4-hydroxy-tetrahydrodipicolinate synthase [Petroclostridium sp. X23]|uniref:4-hydroxy-tetrahydrodipicolinate synthase n=1 Tax=Petroclostridium sp. X23 TaxID=3045146 RepID=UPI0024AD9001|nr:4-hydroxy-tetrahydrodipicolinate synthase [Petroclostridium sp. X23]WHH57990.1 4-hydroxy-tetrahydrodipicolinate synthase [Petroclostridium sp. X23]